LVAVAEGDIAAFFWRKGVEGAVDTGCCGALVLCVLASLAHWRYPKKKYGRLALHVSKAVNEAIAAKMNFDTKTKSISAICTARMQDAMAAQTRRNSSTDGSLQRQQGKPNPNP
jgi:hypothetical protein